MLPVKTGSALKWANPKRDQQGPFVLWKSKSKRTIGWRMMMSKFDVGEDCSSHLHLPGTSD